MAIYRHVTPRPEISDNKSSQLESDIPLVVESQENAFEYFSDKEDMEKHMNSNSTDSKTL